MSGHYGIAPGPYRLLRETFERRGVSPLIYGSRALGVAHPHSDIDLAVTDAELPEETWLSLQEAVDALPMIYKVDLVWLPQLRDPHFVEKILREGRAFIQPD